MHAYQAVHGTICIWILSPEYGAMYHSQIQYIKMIEGSRQIYVMTDKGTVVTN